jgi:DNA polymerase-4
MCGKSTTKELKAMNIKTIGDLARTDKKKLIKKFKSMGEYLYNASRGIDDSIVESNRGERKSISTERTLPKDIDDKDELKEVLYKETLEVARELRRKKLYAKTIGIIYKDILFKKTSSQLTLNAPTNNDRELFEKVMELFNMTFKEEPIRLIGVRLTNLTNKRDAQLSIFDVEDEEKVDKFQETIDKINNKFGKSLIEPAALKLIEKDKFSKK